MLYKLNMVFNMSYSDGLKLLPKECAQLVISDKSGDPGYAEVYRVLKPGGFFCFLRQSSDNLQSKNCFDDKGFAYVGHLENHDLPNGVFDYFVIAAKRMANTDYSSITPFVIVENYLRTSNTHLPEERNYKTFVQLIQRLTTVDDLIVDLCCGSGSISMAAIKTNRNFIAFEKNMDRCLLATNRFVNNTKEA